MKDQSMVTVVGRNGMVVKKLHSRKHMTVQLQAPKIAYVEVRFTDANKMDAYQIRPHHASGC